MKKSVFMICVAAACLTSCTKNELTGDDTPAVVNPDGNLIQLSGTHKTVDVSSTRVPYMGQISESNPLRARILTSNVKDDYSSGNLHADGLMVFKGGTTVSSYDITTINPDNAKFPDPSAPLYICGLYPYDNALENKWGTPTTEAVITFTGKEDVMAAAQKETTQPLVSAGTYPHLVFNHLLTKLEFSLHAKTNAACGKWGEITGIRLLEVLEADLRNEVTVTLKDGFTAFAANQNSSIILYDMNKENDGSLSYLNTGYSGRELSTVSTPCAYTMIAPFVSGTPKDLYFEVTSKNYADKEYVHVQLPFNGYTAGRAFHITFTFGVEDDRIVASAEVIDWVFSGDVEAPVGD